MADADADFEASDTGSEIRKRVHGPSNTGYICGILCIASIICIAAFTMFMCQLYENFGGSYHHDTDIKIRPPISSHQLNSPQRTNSVHDALRGMKISWPVPPPPKQIAKVARYIVHTSDWASIATESVIQTTWGYPFADILSLSDGPLKKSSGVPYMYMTPNDLTSQNILKEARASISVSNTLSDYCHGRHVDPSSPMCVRIWISGNIMQLPRGSREESFAMDAVFSRHPEMKEWPKAHHWFFAKMNVTHVIVQDFFGGAAEVNVEDYFKENPF